MKTRLAALAIVLALPFLFPAVSAASPAQQQLSKQDKTWMTKAHQVNLAEIKAGHMAQKKGKTDTIRSIGQMLVNDHTELDDKLTKAAGNLNITLPSSPSKKQQHMAKKLSGTSGTSFDRLFVKKMTKGHKKAIHKTQKEIKKGSSQKVKHLAEQTLPVLKKHLHKLQEASPGKK